MFYVYLVIGLSVALGGMFFLSLRVSLWVGLAWLAACFSLAVFMPWILEKTLDPLNARRIRNYCAEIGITDVEVRPYPGHYGVHFKKGGAKRYAKCVVTRGKLTWKGLSPADIA